MAEINTDFFQVFQRFFQDKIRTVRQEKNGECGLACISMLSFYFGTNTPLSALQARFSVPESGITIAELGQVADSVGLLLRPIKISMEDIRLVTLPAILFVSNCHYVVLEDVRSDGLTIHDPSRGKYTIGFDVAKAIYTGIAIEASIKHAYRIENEAEERIELNQLWSKISGIKRSLIIIIGMVALYQVLSMAPPFFAQYVIDEVLTYRIQDNIYLVAVGFALIAIIQAAVSLLRGFFSIRLTSMLGYQLHTNLFAHLIKLPLSFFYKRHSGDISSRFSSLSQVQTTYFDSVSSFIIDSFQIVLALFFMLQFSGALTFIALAGVAIQLTIRMSTYGVLHRASLAMGEALGNYTTHFLETIRSPREIKVFQMEAIRTHFWQEKLIDVINSKANYEIAMNWIRNSRDLLTSLEHILTYTLAAFAVLRGGLTVGSLVAFVAFKQRFTSSSALLLEAIINYKLLDVYLVRMSAIALEKNEDELVLGGLLKPKSREGLSPRSVSEISFLEAKELSFKYPGSEDYIFKNLSFSMKFGKTYAINGPSGCGKTTLLMCLMKFLHPDNGEILLNGVNIEYIADYRSYFACVMQDDKLFGGTIMENICAFSEAPDRDRAVECARRACIHDEISGLPAQYDTVLGDLHRVLSGGQAQRVLIARALYKGAKILLLDEVTSQLDLENERLVNQNLAETQALKIIVSHKPDINTIADEVIYLK